MIVGCVVGGLCFICCIYYGIVYCIEQRNEKIKKMRKVKRNRVGDFSGSESDSDARREPVVIFADQSNDPDFTVNQTDMSQVNSLALQQTNI